VEVLAEFAQELGLPQPIYQGVLVQGQLQGPKVPALLADLGHQEDNRALSLPWFSTLPFVYLNLLQTWY
jgi:hypothetical protein